MKLLILWDVDGTLVDFQGLASSIYAEAFQSVTGIELLHEPVTTGRTEWAIIDALLAAHDIPSTDELRTAFFAAIDQSTARMVSELAARGRVLPGVAITLVHLAGIPNVVQSVATGNTPTVAHRKLHVLGLAHLVDLDVGGYGTDSPHRPDLVKHAIKRATQRHGMAPERVIVVGDTPWDIEAARAHGAIAVGLATGAFSEEEPHEVGAALCLAGLRTGPQRYRLYGTLGISVLG